MKAIILAAGQGTRLNKYTKDLPKGMLNFAGKTLLERQIDTIRSVGITSIIVVTGYKANQINYKNVTYYKNPDYKSTNMVESLFRAECELNDDSIVTYGDVIYERKVLSGLMATTEDISVTIDKNWQKYWTIRYGDTPNDFESLVLNSNGTIKELGEENVGYDKIDGRYVGLIKFSKNGLNKLKQVYNEGKRLFWNKPWKRSGKVFQKAYMTDILQALIDTGFLVQTYEVNGGWLEFDTNKDYETMVDMYCNGSLSQLMDLEG